MSEIVVHCEVSELNSDHHMRSVQNFVVEQAHDLLVLKVPITQLISGRRNLATGSTHSVARKIEHAIGLRHGWFKGLIQNGRRDVQVEVKPRSLT